MRYKLRITRVLSLIALLLLILYLYASNRIPSSLGERLFKSNQNVSYHDQPNSEPGSPPLSNSVQSLWSHWSKIIHDDGPRTPHITLSGNAQPVGILPSDQSPRENPANLVLNSEADIESLRLSHAAFLETLQAGNIVGNIFNGTGIVTVGGGEYFGPAIIGLHMLRKTGSTLPVEIFVADTSEYETVLCEDYLPRYGARCVVLSEFLQNGNVLAHNFKVTHYQLKSLAMLFSSFAEILYLDSDSIPLLEPATEMFSTEPYLSTGLVIWPDFWIATESPFYYTISGLPAFPSNLPKSSSEAGQLLMNKKTHLRTLLLAIYYNIYGPDYYYPLLSQGVIGQGDKETFMAAALVVGDSYYRVKTAVAAIGRHVEDEFKGSGMIQHHPSDDVQFAGTQKTDNITKRAAMVRPAFVHANTPKMNAGHLVDEGDLFTVGQKRLRLWGSKEDQERRFGHDLEKVVWELLVKTGCELENVVKEWKWRERLCARLEEHWRETF